RMSKERRIRATVRTDQVRMDHERSSICRVVEQPRLRLQLLKRQSCIRCVVAGTCAAIESAASGDERDRTASAELSDAADLPTTEELTADAAVVPEPLAWTNRQLIDEVALENVLHVLI